MTDESYKDAEVLERLYHEEGLSTRDIGERFGVSGKTIQRWMERHEIERRNCGGVLIEQPSEEELNRLYHEERMTLSEIGDEFGVTKRAVGRWMEKHGIVRRSYGIDATRTPPSYCVNMQGYEISKSCYDCEIQQVRLHRLVAVAEYGFDAVSGNDVHHVNQIPWDNRPDNLEVMSRSEHMSLHRSRQLEQRA